MLLGIQIIGILFGLFMVYFVFLNYKRNDFKISEFIIWSIIWLLFMYVSVDPNSLDFIAKDILSLQRPLDFMIIVGFIFLSFFSFSTYISEKKSRRQLEELVRNIALTTVESKNKKIK